MCPWEVILVLPCWLSTISDQDQRNESYIWTHIPHNCHPSPKLTRVSWSVSSMSLA